MAASEPLFVLRNATGVLDQLATGGGGKGTFAQAIDEAHAKPGFELAHL